MAVRASVLERQFGIGKDFVCLQQLQKENEMKIHLLLCCQKHIEKEHPG